jgi:hypothetical protein
MSKCILVCGAWNDWEKIKGYCMYIHKNDALVCT